MPLTYQDQSSRERPGSTTMKHTEPKTQESLSKSVSRPVNVFDTETVTSLVPIKVKNNEQESKIDELTKLVQMLIDKKINSTQKIQESQPVNLQSKSSKSILKAKAKPYPPCSHYGFNDHHLDDFCNYPKCAICGSYDHLTSGYNRVILVRGVLAESSQSSESSIGVSYTTCGSNVYSTTDHNDFEHFKRGEKIQATKAREPTNSGCSRSMTGVKRNLHKYVEQPSPKESIRELHSKQKNFSIRKCLHLLHMDLTGPVSSMSINHEKYTLVIVDEYSRVFNTRRQQIEETYHVTFDESMEAIRFTNTLVDEIGIDDSSRYPPDEFLHEDDPL
ncbi:hypothetical protein Tco_1115139 [Tanacetum coccineum]